MKVLDFINYFSILILGLIIEYLLSSFYYQVFKNKYRQSKFSFAKYVCFLSVPVLITFFYLRNSPLNLTATFITFSIIGTLAEWIIGFFYEKIIGQKLWTYHRFSIGGYTSWLSVPLWGLCGMVFYLLIQVFL